MFKIKTVIYSFLLITLSSSLSASTDVINYNQDPSPDQEPTSLPQVVNNDNSLPQRPEDPSVPSANESDRTDQHGLLNRMESPRETAEPSPGVSPEVAPAYNSPQDSAPNPQ